MRTIKCKYLTCLIVLSCWCGYADETRDLFPIESETGQPIEPQNQQLEFSSDMNEYFQEELSLPGPILSEQQRKELEIKEKVKIQAIYLGEGSWQVTFIFPQPLVYKESIEDQSLYLVFNQAIDSPDLAVVREQLGYLIQTFSNGYNTLYLVPSRGVCYQLRAKDKVLTLDIIPDYQDNAESTRTLQIAYTRLLIEERNYAAARCALESLSQEYPDDKEVVLLQAGLEGLLPNEQKQWQILRELKMEHPFDEDIRRLYYDAYTPLSPFFSAGWQLQKTIDNATIWLFPFQIEGIVQQTSSHTLYLGAQYQFWRGKLKSIVDPEGVLVSFLGNRSQGNLYMRNEWTTGTYLKGTLYAQETGVYGGGGEVGWLLPFLQGNCILTADWHRPCWEIFEAYAYHGREDRALFQVNSVINRYINWSLASGGRRVGITGVPDGYTSILLQGQFFFYCTVTNPSLALNYGIDAEYVRHEDKKIGSDGQPFNPVPLTSFEDHSFRLYFFYNWKDRLYLTCFAGETFNRLGTNDSTYGIDIKYRKPCPHGVEFQLSAYKFPSITVQGAEAVYVTAMIIGRF